MIPFVLSLAALVGVVVLHMLRPFFVPRRISSARFFRADDETTSHERRPTLARPWRSPPLYAQLLAGGLLAVALWPAGCGSAHDQLGIWILFDTSASMSTRVREEDGAAARFDLAKERLRGVVATLGDGPVPTLFHLSTFDLGMETHGLCLTAESAGEQLAGLAHRPLGTDLVTLRAVLESPAGPLPAGADAPCALTHRLVVSDLPAPEWLAELAPGVVWLDIAEPVANAGFEILRARRDPLTGEVGAVEVGLRAHGAIPVARLRVESVADPADTREVVVDWSAVGWWSERFELAPGRWRLELSPGGGYGYDDRVEIEVPAPSPNPLRIVGLDGLDAPEPTDRDATSREPLLVVGRGYGAGGRPAVGFFNETSPLLEGLDLDDIQATGPRGVALPEGFEPVLTGLGGRDEVWVARRRVPRAVLVPGLAGERSDGAGRSARRLVANALRWLAEGRPDPPLFYPTTVEDAEPGGIRLALHPGEGKTDDLPESFGTLADLRGGPTVAHARGGRRWLLAAAGLVFLLDQALLGWWGFWR